MSETTSHVTPTGRHRVPAVDGWYTIGEDPHLIGVQCGGCGTYVFPPRAGECPNPACDSDDLREVALSRVGKVWSYTENRYAPPPPYKAAEPFEPYALVAVQLEKEGLIVLGQAPKGILAADLKVGLSMQLETDVLYSDTDDDGNPVDHIVYVWAPAGAKAMGAQK